MKKRAVILGCIFSASILLSGSHILSLLNDTAKKETKTVSSYQTASQEEANPVKSSPFLIRQPSCINSIIMMKQSNF